MQRTVEPESKASGLLSWTKVVRASVDGASWSRFVAALPAESRALFERPPLAVTWLPVRLTLPIWQIAAEVLFHGDLEKMTEIGRRQIREDLSTIYRVFIRILSPRYVAERAASLYGTYFRNNGTMAVLDETDHSLDVQVDGVPQPTPAFYASLRGSIIGTIEMTGVHDVRVALVEGGGTTSRARFRATWR
jgi:hypothetical protein